MKNKRQCLCMISGIFLISSFFALLSKGDIFLFVNVFWGANGKVGAIPSLVGFVVLSGVGAIFIFCKNIERRWILTCTIIALISFMLITLAEYFYEMFNARHTLMVGGFDNAVKSGFLGIIFAVVRITWNKKKTYRNYR